DACEWNFGKGLLYDRICDVVLFPARPSQSLLLFHWAGRHDFFNGDCVFCSTHNLCNDPGLQRYRLALWDRNREYERFHNLSQLIFEYLQRATYEYDGTDRWPFPIRWLRGPIA